MSNPRFGSVKSSADNECPILMGHSDKEAWVRQFNNYLTIRRERTLDINHPSMEWISNGFSMISLNQNQSATMSLPPDVSVTVTNVVTDIVTQPIANMRKKLVEHSMRHSVSEVNSRQWALN